mmetsp:Transcript_8979/g.27390  ORF Transcript_8979/g.27390 Transcript_8979/m.27390 type:complete len:408 (+) Transcript_8979:592-1815(+)
MISVMALDSSSTCSKVAWLVSIAMCLAWSWSCFLRRRRSSSSSKILTCSQSRPSKSETSVSSCTSPAKILSNSPLSPVPPLPAPLPAAAPPPCFFRRGGLPPLPPSLASAASASGGRGTSTPWTWDWKEYISPCSCSFVERKSSMRNICDAKFSLAATNVSFNDSISLAFASFSSCSFNLASSCFRSLWVSLETSPNERSYCEVCFSKSVLSSKASDSNSQILASASDSFSSEAIFMACRVSKRCLSSAPCTRAWPNSRPFFICRAFTSTVSSVIFSSCKVVFILNRASSEFSAYLAHASICWRLTLPFPSVYLGFCSKIILIFSLTTLSAKSLSSAESMQTGSMNILMSGCSFSSRHSSSGFCRFRNASLKVVTSFSHSVRAAVNCTFVCSNFRLKDSACSWSGCR